MATETQSQLGPIAHENDQPSPLAASRWRRWLARVGIGGLIFFTVKGLLWLIVPAAIAWWSTRG